MMLFISMTPFLKLQEFFLSCLEINHKSKKKTKGKKKKTLKNGIFLIIRKKIISCAVFAALLLLR